VGLTLIIYPLAFIGALILLVLGAAWRSWFKFKRGLDAE
jgi:hypothetical protein